MLKSMDSAEKPQMPCEIHSTTSRWLFQDGFSSQKTQIHVRQNNRLCQSLSYKFKCATPMNVNLIATKQKTLAAHLKANMLHR